MEGKYIIKIAISKAITPPSLLGIERRIAYSQRKYHSGWMWLGVINGLASMKFSGSFKIFGINRKNIINIIRDVINPIISFRV